MPVHPLRKALVIRLSSLGDVVLSTPFLRSIRQAHPDAELHMAVRREYAELVRHHPALDRVIEIDVSEGRAGLSTCNHALRSERYDAVFDLHRNFRSLILRRGVGRTLHVIRKRTVRRFLLVSFKTNLFTRIVPVSERYLETAAAYGVTADGKGPEVVVPAAVEDAARSALSAAGFDPARAAVGFAPGARHATKRWPVERFAALRDRIIAETGLQILLVGGPDDIPQAAALHDDSRRIVDMSGRLTMLETAAVLDRCRAVVSNDSGLMHLATARGVPVVALFGSTVREFGFFPYNSPSRILEVPGLSCRPCTHIGRASCPKGHFRCMLDINGNDVFEAVCGMAEQH